MQACLPIRDQTNYRGWPGDIIIANKSTLHSTLLVQEQRCSKVSIGNYLYLKHREISFHEIF